MRTIKAVIFLMPFVICSNKIFCQSALDTSESKVDYLEQIYFSGENKEGLLNEIDMMIQKFDGKEVTPAIAKQYGFLSGIKSQAANAAKSCDVLDLISAGIFELDAAEATRQGVHRPSKKASADVSGALKNISGIGNTLSSSSWNTYLLSGGKINTLGVTGKVAGVTNTIGTVASTYDEVKKFAGALGLGKK
ncbi:MAG TPA: hypothetical protein PL045_11130, partial [Chitinophagaceae bacterium]|nr:hypothetical protein [Chitinophagaceae bacterium]